MARCLCLLSLCSIEKDKKTDRAGFRQGAFFRPALLQGNLGISTEIGQFPLELCRKFSTSKVDAQSEINWTVVGQLS